MERVPGPSSLVEEYHHKGGVCIGQSCSVADVKADSTLS